MMLTIAFFSVWGFLPYSRLGYFCAQVLHSLITLDASRILSASYWSRCHSIK